MKRPAFCTTNKSPVSRIAKAALSAVFAVGLTLPALSLPVFTDGSTTDREQAYATVPSTPPAGEPPSASRIHFISVWNSDAIVLESDGHFGIVDSGEDSDFPDGSDPRYPDRPGIIRYEGTEDRVIDYLHSIGVTQDNLDFYLGTHPHSDHIGSADEVIREFRPKRVYTPEYQDAYISNEDGLWDNQYVYDRLIEAANEVGATLILDLNENAPITPSEETVDANALKHTAISVDYLTDEEVKQTFSVSPTDPADPNNPEQLPDGVIAVPVTDDPNPCDTQLQDPSYIGNPSFDLGSMHIDIMNFGTSYKEHPVPDANYFSWGVKVTVLGKTAFLAGDINNYDGDEDALAKALGHVDLLKLGHHGVHGSNTYDYLKTLSPSITVQTAITNVLPDYVIRAFKELQPAYYSTQRAYELGLPAVVATFEPQGEDITVDYPSTVHSYYIFASDPCMAAFEGGKPAAADGWQQGWQLVYGGWYYFNHNPFATRNTWIGPNDGQDAWYYLGENAVMRTGSFFDGSNYYLADDNGRWIEGRGWLQQNDVWYYLKAGSVLQTDWHYIDRAWYYFDPETGIMRTGSFFDGSNHYLADDNGKWIEGSGWLQQNDVWYYLKAGSVLQTDWQYIGRAWYYFDPETGIMQTGWQSFDSGWYYLDPETGDMHTGWQFIDGVWYYLDPGTGIMQTGWHYIDGEWYYFDPETGIMQTG